MECLSLKDGNQNSLFQSGVCNNWYAFISYPFIRILSSACFMWIPEFFPSKRSLKTVFLLQLLECPSIYELLANPNFQWKDTPLLQIWRENLDNNGKKSALLESYEPAEAIEMIEKALSNNEVSPSHFKLWYDSAYVDAYSFCKFCNGRSLLMECIFLCPLIWIY